MTPELDSRPDDVGAEVEQILQDVDEQLAELDGDEESQEAALGELRALGGQASELLEDTDPKSLIVAVDTSDDPPDPDKDSLATVMEQSDSEAVAKLRTILTLSKLPDVDDGSLEDRVDQIRELRSLSGSSSAADEAAPENGSDDETDADGAEAVEEDTESTVDDEADTDATEGSAAAKEGEPDADAGSASETEATGGSSDDASSSDSSERVKQKFQERLDDFRDGVHSYRESLTGEDDDDADDDAADDESDSGMGSSSTAGRRGTTFSTVPSRGRIGITGTTRFSTMNPRKNKDSD